MIKLDSFEYLKKSLSADNMKFPLYFLKERGLGGEQLSFFIFL